MGRTAESVARYMLAKYGGDAEGVAFRRYAEYWGRRNLKAMAFWSRVVAEVKREALSLKRRGEV